MRYLKLIILLNLLVLSNHLNAQNNKIDSVSYGIGLTLSAQVRHFKKKLTATDTKLNEEAFSLGFNATELIIPTEKLDGITFDFEKNQRDLVQNKKKSKGLNISDDGSIETLMDSISYSYGAKFGNITNHIIIKQLEKFLQFNFDKKFINLGYDEGIKANDSTFNSNVKNYGENLIAFQKSHVEEINMQLKLDGEKFLLVNKAKKGVKTTESGLQYLVMKEGKGRKPVSSSTVNVHYHETLLNGTVFKSSIERHEPITLSLNKIIKGWWIEGLQLMSTGSKYKFFIPYNLAYGEQDRVPKIKPFSTLIIEIELLEILSTEQVKAHAAKMKQMQVQDEMQDEKYKEVKRYK